MTSRKLDELSADIDDASTIARELKPDDCDGDKLDELQKTLAHAKDVIDEIDQAAGNGNE
jgi:hypothetical protein